MTPETHNIEEWKSSRSGAWASRGFHYQHLLSALILVRQWAGLAPSGYLIPEGLEDCVVELADYHLWLQIKSRSGGTFSENEAGKILDTVESKANSSASTATIKSAIALEQPCNARHVGSIENLFDGDARAVIVCGEPEKEILQLLTTSIQTAEIIAEGIASDLYKLVADASQENASLPFELRRRISSTEVERRIFERLEADDPSAIGRALVSGALEPVDFRNPIGEPAFYQGVKVRSGHVAAGLVLDRPEDTANVVRSLRQKRHVLISGPSGAGKSALMWLVSHVLAGEFRWYQITTGAAAANADAIVRFIRARRPTDESPIGLAFDEVGAANSDLWDVLVRELRGVPSVYFLGSMRQEDVALIANQSDTEFIAVSLDEKLAESVWQKLHTNAQTSWEHWLEPFEQSEGLMLEYVHLLTQGQRLQAVIDEQVRQRQQEERYDELAIIRSTAVISVRGAEIQVSKLCALLNMKPEDASRALSRLLDEHLVRESRPGVLGGLHLLRSQALSIASHDEAVFLSKDSFWQSLPAVTHDSLPRAVQSLLAEEGDEASSLQRLADILDSSSDIETWVGILTGLGLAFLERQVASFMQTLEQHGVQRAQWSLASMFGDPGINIPELSEFEHWQNLRDAVLAFRALPKNDLRPACLKHLPKGSTIPPFQNIQQANKLLSCLAPICGSEPVQLTISPDFVGDGDQDIRQVAALLSTAYLIGPDVVENLVQAFGGEQVLFDWYRSQTPWVTMPTVDPDGSHGRTVRSDWCHVAEQEQPDPHETICGICETLIAISPESDAAASDAVNPQAQAIAVRGYTPWSKNMPRENIPAKARVAWNVAFRQILLARSAADSLTVYTRQMAELIKRTEKVFRSFTEKWIKGKSIANADRLVDEINEIIEEVNALAYATPEKPSSEMTAPTQGAGNDDTLGALLTGVLGNLVKRISQLQAEGGLKGMATFAGSLAAQAQEHEKSPIWRTSSEPPLRELGALKDRLSDVAGILHEMAHDDDQSAIQGIVKVARKGQLGKAVRAAARRCHLLADQRFYKRLQTLKDALNAKGWNVQCCSRQIDEADGVYWPAQEVAVLVEITDFETDAGYIEDALSLSQKHLGTDWRFRIVPVLNGYVLPALALLPSSHMPLPDQDFAKDWHAQIGRPFLSPEVLDRFDEALAACTQLSAVLTCRDPENLHPDEEKVFSKSIESFERNRDFVAEAAEKTCSEHLVWAYDYLNATWKQVVGEFEAVKAGQSVAAPLCMTAHQALAGQANDQSVELASARILILQEECMSVVGNDDASSSGTA